MLLNNYKTKYFIAISITAAITTLQLSSTVFSGLSSSPSDFLSKTREQAASTDTITDRATAATIYDDGKIIPSASAQSEEGGGDEFISEPAGGGGVGEGETVDEGLTTGAEEDVPVEEGEEDVGAEQVEPTTTTIELNCDDGIDDDADGLIDLEDTQDCPLQAPTSPSTSTNPSTAGTENRSIRAAEEQMPLTSEFVSPQAQTEEFCGDNVDNNGNGQIDEGCPDTTGAETPTPPLTCPPGQGREPDTNECVPIPTLTPPPRTPSPLTPSPDQQQSILPPLTPSQPEGNELGTAGPPSGKNTSGNITDELHCIGCILEARPNTEAARAIPQVPN